MTLSYPAPEGGHPGQEILTTGRAVFSGTYAVIPRTVMRDIVTSFLPHWSQTRLWIVARPLTGFAETFSHYIMEVAPGGGSNRPECDPQAEAVLFVTEGNVRLSIDGNIHDMTAGGYAYLGAGCDWRLSVKGNSQARFHWLRKSYEPVDSISPPESFVTNENNIVPVPMSGTEGRWTTTRFVDPNDLGHDMHVNIVTFEPGAAIPFCETHVMEHGIYVLEGKAVYRLNRDWIEVEAGDYIWLRAFCPQACYAGGPGNFRYLLYKDVNRHMPLHPVR